MKKKTLRILALILALAVAAGGFALYRVWHPRVQSFSLDEYQRMIAQFPSDKVLGPVADTDDLLQKAEAVWTEIYGEQVREEKPYRIFYDEQNAVWLVSGSLKPFRLGGTAQILVENDTGKVLAVWHGK